MAGTGNLGEGGFRLLDMRLEKPSDDTAQCRVRVRQFDVFRRHEGFRIAAGLELFPPVPAIGFTPDLH